MEHLRGPDTLTVRDALELDVLRCARVVAGHGGLERPVRWVHIIDIPEMTPSLRGGELMLTTGYGWPHGASQQRKTIRALNDVPLSGILFETGKFLRQVPATVRREADRLNLPILAAPWDLYFVDVTKAVHRAVLDRQYAHISRVEAIQRRLTHAAVDAGNLQDIAETLATLIGRCVGIENTYFQPIAHAPSLRFERPVRGTSTDRIPALRAILTQLERQSLFGKLRSTRHPVRIPATPGVDPHDGRVIWPIRTATELLGFVWIAEGATPVTEVDVRAAEHTATLAALHMLRQRAVAAVEERVRDTCVDAMIRGESDRSPSLRERAQLLGFDPGTNYAVGVLTAIAPAAPRSNHAAGGLHESDSYGELVRAALERLGAPSLVTRQPNRIVFLVPAPSGWAGTRSFVEQLWRMARDLDRETPLILAMGDIYQGSLGIANSYREADNLCNMVSEAGCYFYHEHHVLQLLHATDKVTLRKLSSALERTLGDRIESADVVKTLFALLRANFNVGDAARSLGVHRNTVRQRLARLRQTRGVRLEDPQFWAELVLVKEAEDQGIL